MGRLRHAGFTLLETLVVMILVGLLATLLMQGLRLVSDWRSRYLDTLAEVQGRAMREYWFRTTVGGILPVHPAEEGAFGGDEMTFSGLSLETLDGDPGVPMAFGWRLQRRAGKLILQYRNAGGDYWDIESWPGGSGSFRFRDAVGVWRGSWPPAEGRPSVPEAVELDVISPERAVAWSVWRSGRGIVVRDPRIAD